MLTGWGLGGSSLKENHARARSSRDLVIGQVGAALTALRGDPGLSPAQLGDEIGWPLIKVQQTENADATVSLQDLCVLIDLLHADAEAELIRNARRGRRPGDLDPPSGLEDEVVLSSPFAPGRPRHGRPESSHHRDRPPGHGAVAWPEPGPGHSRMPTRALVDVDRRDRSRHPPDHRNRLGLRGTGRGSAHTAAPAAYTDIARKSLLTPCNPGLPDGARVGWLRYADHRPAAR